MKNKTSYLSLKIILRVSVAVEDDDCVGSSKVDPDSSCSRAQKHCEDGACGVAIDSGLPLLACRG